MEGEKMTGVAKKKKFELPERLPLAIKETASALMCCRRVWKVVDESSFALGWLVGSNNLPAIFWFTTACRKFPGLDKLSYALGQMAAQDHVASRWHWGGAADEQGAIA
ncbi:MAG: hypothetical protein E6Q97_11115 [Desulfurellales bacterium]|nr:MAG: hypothetical protein E6Q97_11115 [Desulfurellales bacterium]